MTTQAVERLRLVGGSNTNKVMMGELTRLAARALGRRPEEPEKQGTGALVYPFDAELAALAVQYHRTSARVLWDLFESNATRLEPLYAELKAAIASDERRWLWSGAKFSVLAFGVDDFAAGERQIVGVVKNALLDGAGARGLKLVLDPDRAELYVSVRMPAPGTLVISVDLAGRPMHQRGYRLVSGAAPLREDLAAQLVMLTRHDARSEALIDPMAGSGTIVIEAACLARGRAVWQSGRKPTARFLPALATYFDERASAIFGDTRPVLFAAEREPETFGVMTKNLETAGVGTAVETRAADFRAWSPAELRARAIERGAAADHGVILCNPPYGQRIGKDLERLYAELGRWCREFAGWRAGILVANADFERCFGGRPRVKKPILNGPLKGYFLLYDL